MTTPLQSYPAPDDRQIFAEPAALRTAPGLRWRGNARGGALSLFDPIEKFERVAEPAAAAAVESHPFKVTKGATANHFKVKAGTCEGQLITAQTIDVGATRPVAILAYPQYTLSIDSGVFVNTIAVKSGANAPVLVSSTTTLDDVDSGITSAGTQARALIAYIDVGDVIYQITTGNIFGTWDDGGLNGTAAGHFNKKA